LGARRALRAGVLSRVSGRDISAEQAAGCVITKEEGARNTGASGCDAAKLCKLTGMTVAALRRKARQRLCAARQLASRAAGRLPTPQNDTMRMAGRLAVGHGTQFFGRRARALRADSGAALAPAAAQSGP
jgi:hypothetical protein